MSNEIDGRASLYLTLSLLAHLSERGDLDDIAIQGIFSGAKWQAENASDQPALACLSELDWEREMIKSNPGSGLFAKTSPALKREAVLRAQLIEAMEDARTFQLSLSQARTDRDRKELTETLDHHDANIAKLMAELGRLTSKRSA